MTRLPRVRAEFAAGRLSYSKVRALTRIAETPGGENGSYGDEDLVVLAKSATAAQLDRIARGVRGAGGRSEAAARALTRRLRWWYTDDGMFEGHFRLTPDEGAVVLQALNAAMDTLEHRNVAADCGAATDTADDPNSPAEESDPPAEEADTEAGCQPSSTTAPPPGSPRRRAGLAADALGLLAETFLTGTPAYAHGGDKYRVVVYADAEALATPASGSRDSGGPDSNSRDVASRNADDHDTLGPTTEHGATDHGANSPGTAAEYATAEPRLRPGGCELADGTAVPRETARRIACAAGVVGLLCDRSGHPLEISDLTRYPSAATERAVRARDRDTCCAPGCGARLGLEVHHIVHWADGGPTKLWNLLLFCRFHHWLVHEGGISVSTEFTNGSDERVVVFRQADGTVIPPTGQLAVTSSERSGERTADDIERIAEILRPVIGRTTVEPDPLTPPWWNGDRLHLDYAVSVIAEAQRRTQASRAA